MKAVVAVLVVVIIVGIVGFILWQTGLIGGKPAPVPVAVEEPVTPTAFAPITPTLPAPAQTEHYKVQHGDTLWSISQKFYGNGKYAKIIQEANKITDPSKLQINQDLIIPPKPEGTESMNPTPPPPVKPKVIWHTVKKGDTLRSLALQYYHNAAKDDLIFQANKDKIKTKATSLQDGWRLKIPPLEPETKPGPTGPVSPSGSPE